MLPSFCTDEVIRIRPGTKTERGSTIFDWSNPDRLVIEGCSVQPAATTLSQDGRVLGISESMTAYLPDDSDVKAGDRIEYDGNVYTITGEPKIWKGPLNMSNMQLNLTMWRG
jgi:hypothetical protein